jgi:hypothetical protein
LQPSQGVGTTRARAATIIVAAAIVACGYQADAARELRDLPDSLAVSVLMLRALIDTAAYPTEGPRSYYCVGVGDITAPKDPNPTVLAIAASPNERLLAISACPSRRTPSPRSLDAIRDTAIIIVSPVSLDTLAGRASAGGIAIRGPLWAIVLECEFARDSTGWHRSRCRISGVAARTSFRSAGRGNQRLHLTGAGLYGIRFVEIHSCRPQVKRGPLAGHHDPNLVQRR